MMEMIKKLEDVTKDNCLLSYGFELQSTPNGSLVLVSKKRNTRIGKMPEKVVAAISNNIKDKKESAELSERLVALIQHTLNDEDVLQLLIQKGILDEPRIIERK